ncbi:ecto-NOX disulfide-thiol exchanger 2 isoform X1 [Homalodisca vitripennis]|nr:ecto-NOX disulfide-thiol exchanger 2 isoform X1 [Homalodisca vitripennis]
MGPPMQMPMMAHHQGQGQMMGGPMVMGPMIGPQGFPQGMMGPLMNPEQMGNSPGMNDAPLEFNTNKNKPPMPLTGEELEREQRKALSERERDRNGRDSDRENRRERDRNRDRGRDRRDRERDRDRREERESSNSNSRDKSPLGGSSPTPQGQSDMPPPTPAPMWGGMMGPMGYPVMGMNPMMGAQMMDPNMMMGQYNMMGMAIGPEGPMMGPDGTIIPPDPSMVSKEIIHFKTFTLFPPSPNAPPPTTRERPPGCKTIFVGGLPENATEEMIRELFGRCGEMLTVRLNNKKFCHIRFLHEASVDQALYFSGYRMRIGSNTDIPNTGRLHVDYAQARDDQYEWECRQRQLQREQRHRDRMEKERLRVPSPPPVVHYSDHEANIIADKIKSMFADEQFTKAVQVVITWLERGDCNKRNSNTFYSMIQSTNSHVRRLLTEKATYEEELTRAKELMKGRMQGLLIQFSQIERVFSAASHKKVWDHFTKPQRKNIEMWKKQATEIKTVELEENLLAGGDEEMEVSDTDEDYPTLRKKPRKDDPSAALKEENDSLRCQLEAYKNEVDLVKVDLKVELEQKDKQLKMCQQTLQGMQQQLLDAKRKQGEEELKVLELQTRLKAKQTKEKETKEGEEGKEKEEPDGEVDTTDSLLLLSSKLSEKEAKLIGLISIFLHVHPFGAGVDYIWSYLQKLDPTLKTSEVETVMARFPSMFLQELSGIGANMERRWVYAGYKTTKLDS